MKHPRALAAQIIHKVIAEKHSLDKVFSTIAWNNFTSSDQGFIRELSYGTLRWYYRLKPITEKLLHKPLATKHHDILCLLMSALYQLIELQTPSYAAISETVNAARALKKNWATGLLNKTLRVFDSQSETILSAVDKDNSCHYAHPPWLIQQLQQDWPQDWQQIAAANNLPAPMTLRINPQLTNREEYLQQLQDKGIEASLITDLPYAIQLKQAVAIEQLPQFSEGACYIQDEAGQYVSSILQLEAGQTILDACAAPGSKTTDILAAEPGIEVITAIDNNATRIEKIKENIARLKLPESKIIYHLGDATKTKDWWNKKSFDRILIDAPCSATGVIRRHPDIKILRQANDISQQAKQQLHLLELLWPLLKPYGLLLYSTCSVLKAENENISETFIGHHSDASSIPLNLKKAVSQKYGSQILPTPHGPDGFYYALLQKISS